jgi:dipeptidyl aminopeptidase/acylaminoacyl peptidase
MRLATLPLLLATTAAALTAQPAPSPASASWDPQAVLRTEDWVRPPANLERMILAPRVDISFENPSPDRRWFLRTAGPTRGDIAAYGAPHIWLGGVQVDTRANRARSLTTSNATGLTLVDPRTGATTALRTPAGASISSPVWSPRGTHVAFIANFLDRSVVYLADITKGTSAPLTPTPLLATLVTGISFTGDGSAIVATIVPANRGPAPTRPGGLELPQVRLTEGRAVPQPVHFSLLADPHEKALLRYHGTSQLALIDVASRRVRPIGTPAMIRAVDASPDGRWFRVTRITEPFSYLVPVNSFGTVQELWDANGKVVTTLATSPLREAGRTGPGPGAAPAGPDTGRRNLQWNPVGPGLVYLQSVYATGGNGATPGGNAPSASAPGGAARPQPPRGGAQAAPGGRAQAVAVRYVQWKPPFGPGDTATLFTGSPQFTNAVPSADGRWLFVTDSGATIAVRTADPSQRRNLGRAVSLPAGGGGFGGGGFGGGRGNDTLEVGTVLTRTAASGAPVVMLGRDGKTVALAGTRTPRERWHEQAPRPWVDRLDIESGARTRVHDSPADAYESFVAPLDDDLSQYIFTRESPTVIADAWLRDVAAGTTRKLTSNVDVGPEVTGAIRKRFQVVRPRDGYRIWVDVALPRDWRPGQRLPGIIWFYPREYTSETDYLRSRWSVNINRFPEVPSARPASSTELWVSQGYALITPDIPIFGDSGRMNDNYTRDLKENLDAVLDAVVDSGFVDRARMGLGGHSYGAFSTVNAMTLVPYFKAGIAGDGMYNRTLTPFGFQSERRNFFEAKATYLDMSPFLRADNLSGALLLYHAWEDQNQGTAPLSSTRLMAALQGLGKPAALYMYPYEDHSVATYQSDLDLWARWVAWMDVHLKGAAGGAVRGANVVP